MLLQYPLFTVAVPSHMWCVNHVHLHPSVTTQRLVLDCCLTNVEKQHRMYHYNTKQLNSGHFLCLGIIQKVVLIYLEGMAHFIVNPKLQKTSP